MRQSWKLGVVAALSLAIGGVSSAGPKPEYALVPPSAAKLVPLNPKNPQGGQMAVLSGDPKTGPVALMLKLPKGTSPVHWHTSAYYAVTVEGTTRHWLAGKEAEARDNPPGTFWYQPGGDASTTHGDACVSESCTLFVYMAGKFDVQPPKK